jgi:hypothetical protein
MDTEEPRQPPHPPKLTIQSVLPPPEIEIKVPPQPPHPPGAWATLARKVTGVVEIIGDATDGFGIFVLSVLAVIVLPCLPVILEWIHISHVGNATKTITTAVLAAGFIFSAEHNVLRVIYAILFLAGFSLTLGTGPQSPVGIDNWDGTLLLAVALIHAAERFFWHVFLERPFPDWLKSSEE